MLFAEKIKKLILKIRFIRLINYKRNKFRNFSALSNLNLSKDSLFIDIGGNIGQVSEYINDKYGCRILIYEPHPGCLRILKKKFKNDKNIKIVPKAVSNHSGKLKLFMHRNSLNRFDTKYAQGTSLEEKKTNIDKKKYIISNSISIKKVLKKFKKIDIMKIDIECHEYKILPEIFKKKKKIKKIFCELNGKTKYKYLKKNYDETINYLKKNNLYGTWFVNWT